MLLKKFEKEESVEFPLSTAEQLKKLNLSGIWKEREIEDSVFYSQELRKKLVTRDVL
ncbi:hypothetical protein LEP1GSC035_0297 [Leptospira noguchii str. 2007001578]|uniref:Toxin-antitoxin system, antitoxin component, ribbon-helix-helix domain protein n=1 Tax=Leptospira noguchii str. 2007001578 TaxID=1049974 RepID=A0ABN0J311_9LEPT|nr:hypothetical protein LEP1GSC035_0297 [Leptospira noguchii str. 2007001578]